MPKISVIIPVYNGEEYLRECLDSLIRQTLHDIEIIAVDNGSEDASAAILAEYAAKDRRIKVLTLNPNRGPSGARNAALDIAGGDYIAFCDCDDMVPQNAYSLLYAFAKRHGCDVAVGDYTEVYDKRADRVNAAQYGADLCFFWGGTIWNKIYNRRFLNENGLRLPSYHHGEDTLFLAQIYDRHPSIGYVDRETYAHRHVGAQLTFTYRVENLLEYVETRTKYNEILDKYALPGKEHLDFNPVRFLFRFWRMMDEADRERSFPAIQSLLGQYRWDCYRGSVTEYIGLTPENFASKTYAAYKREVLDRPFKFSAIVPVYNTEPYLAETLESVIGQSIGFRENIQIILVNNATKDESGKICQEYRSRYPRNIVYVKLEKNAGPNGARSAGMKYAQGKYINFLDSDDKWSSDAFEKAWFFLEAHPEVDFVSCRLKHFDAMDKWHALDYKFQNTRIVDIRTNFNYVQLHLCSCFIRREAAERHPPDVELHHAEDAKFLTDIVLDRCKYGVIREATFYYRARKNNSSTLQNVTTSREWYFVTPVAVYHWVIEQAKIRQPGAVAYAQFLAAYELQWRLFRKMPADLTGEERDRYRQLLWGLLQVIDDEIIWSLRNITNRQKTSVLAFKHSGEHCDRIETHGGSLYCNGIDFRKLNNSDILRLELMDVKDDTLTLYGSILRFDKDDLARFVLFDSAGGQHPIQIVCRAESPDDRTVMADCMKKECFSVQLPIRDDLAIWFAFVADDGIYPIRFSNGERFPLTHGLIHSHCRRGGWHFHLEGTRIVILRRSFLLDLKKQLSLWQELFRKKKHIALLCHIYLYFLSLLPKRKQIWIFSDRAAYAGDNGEWMFRYVNSRHDPNIKTYFSVSASSPDHKRLKSEGFRVLANESQRFKLMYLKADRLISSYFEWQNLDPLGVHEEFLKDLVVSKRVYLQHGVIKDDMTSDNAKLRCGVEGFVTTAEDERNSLFTLPYGYSEDELWLTGLARYDSITDCIGKAGNIVFIAPTWRESGILTFRKWGSDGLIMDDEQFLETKFYRFYSQLLNDERVLSVMRAKGYSGVLRLHPVMRHFEHYFEANDVFSIEGDTWNYREDIERTALLVTDYSSTAFDYAYVYRPCIYAQFDRCEFIAGHSYKPGYFDYERDGFGPVCYDYESTVQAIISAIENDCVMEEKYHKRAEDFFAFRDGRNCERIYQKILQLDQGA